MGAAIALHTSLAQVRQKGACYLDTFARRFCHQDGRAWPVGGLEELARRAGDEPINLLTVFEALGLKAMLWCLQATIEPLGDRSHLLHMVADLAASVLPIFESESSDPGPREALDLVRGVRANAPGPSKTDVARAAQAAHRAAMHVRTPEAAAAAQAARAAALTVLSLDWALDVADEIGAAGGLREKEEVARILRRYLRDDLTGAARAEYATQAAVSMTRELSK